MPVLVSLAPGPGRHLLSRSSPRARGAAPLLPKKSPRLEKEAKRLKSDPL